MCSKPYTGWQEEEIASTKITSLLELIEKMDADGFKYFQTRSETVLRKMLLLLAKFVQQYDYNKKNAETVFIDVQIF